ncbi:DUF4168 domain-containing protein [Brumimicrobium oceani]|uniref:DUF4168 domain-containing protein n=1 Tax=Brumimicrobium oceani TaxID=2100725 RepID=A0A2U2XBA7_9FLAO|nr:DUF4168 domain-containing protein [Brumimicrobium oceani]PWH85040.1 hypothetical protein DIT68_11760 [Brumimicrobium oceani]
MKITTILLASALSFGTAVIGQQEMIPAPVQEQNKEVTDQELEKFALIYQDVQIESQEMQKEAIAIIQTEGMELERFNEISQAQADPNNTSEASEEEKAQITKINTQMREIQSSFQSKIAEIVREKGMTVQRYQEVYTAVQQDTELQQKFGALIQG